jgi:putative PIN family toxin of toxin-antitoxin system
VRLVLDTNTVISGLLWHGAPGKLIDAAQAGTISLFTSAPWLAELRGVLSRRKFAGQRETRALQVGRPAVTAAHTKPLGRCRAG